MVVSQTFDDADVNNVECIRSNNSRVDVSIIDQVTNDLHTQIIHSHTRHQALGPELILVYKQSALRWLTKSSLDDRLPLLPARPAVTFPAQEHHRPLTSTRFYCLVTETHRCEQLALSCYAALPWVRTEATML